MEKCCVLLRAPKGSDIVWGMNPRENGHVEGRSKLICYRFNGLVCNPLNASSMSV